MYIGLTASTCYTITTTYFLILMRKSMNKELIVQIQNEITEKESQAIEVMTTGELVVALEETSLEGFPDLTQAKSLFKSLVNKFIQPNTDNAPIKYLLSQRDINIAVQKLTKIKVHNLSAFNIYIPNGLTGAMVPYLQYLNAALSELSSVDTRILRPLEVWAGQLISDPTFASKVWVNTFGASANTTQITNNLKHFFATDTKQAQVNMAAYTNVYIGESDIMDTSHLLGRLVDTTDGLLNGLLSERVTSVTTLVQKAMSLESFNKIPNDRIKPIVTLVSQAATELELISMLIFQVKSAATAYTNTINKINEELK